MSIRRLIPTLRTHFDRLQERFTCFCECGCQLEGGFKGELLRLLDSAVRTRAINDFDREVSTPAGKIDLLVGLDPSVRLWIEIKHWLIGKQRGTSYHACFYFGDPTSVGIKRDVAKLCADPCRGAGFMLLFLTANPGDEDWRRGILRFNEKFAPLRVEGLTTPSEFPPSYFIGVLSASRGHE